MKSLIKLSCSVLIMVIFYGCRTTGTGTMDNSFNSLDWPGKYRGTTVNAGGNNVITTLYLYPNSTYQMSTMTTGDANSIETNGTFRWSRAGSEITLTDARSGMKTIYKVGENKVTKINENGKNLSDNKANTMTKIKEDEITEKYWKLIEINGNPVKMDESFNREPHMILRDQDHRVTGSSGCNTFNGSYELGGPNQIRFSKVAATMMACPNMEIEQQMFSMFEIVDNYTISSDGKYLSLNRARMAPLARFEVVYLR